MNKFLDEFDEIWIDDDYIENFNIGDLCKIRNDSKLSPVFVHIYYNDEWLNIPLFSDSMQHRKWIVEDIGILDNKPYLKFKGSRNIFLSDDFYLI